jgi:hypothetical protein
MVSGSPENSGSRTRRRKTSLAAPFVVEPFRREKGKQRAEDLDLDRRFQGVRLI